MALARIITHSQVCSRELALNLLTRGYAVEIFSPENVPDNTADLELRVDIGPGDQLIASVQARDGEREASLEFVRHLKEPTVNSLHGLSELGEAVHFSGEPVTFNATAGIEDMGMVADALQPPVKDPSPANLVLLNRDLDPGIDTEGDVRQILSPTPAEPAKMAQPTIGWRPQAAQLRVRSAGWPWRAALILILIALPAAVLGFGIRRTGKAAARSSETLPAEKLAAVSRGVNLPSAVGAHKDGARYPGQVLAVPLPPTVEKESGGNFRHAPKEVQVAKVGVPTASPRNSISPDDLIARDTVTYLDKRFEPTPKAKPSKSGLPGDIRGHPTHRSGMVAANTVTSINKPAPKAVK
jgi:hypothetical protein